MLKLEINTNFHPNNSDLGIIAGGAILFTPAVGKDDYWSYRVKLSKKQAIIGFPKFGLTGIGFAVESDWNTNLPSGSDTLEIYNHIKHNKGDKSITKATCIKAIKMIQDAVNSQKK